MKLSDYIVYRLEEYVKDIFLVSGGGCIHMVDSLSKSNIKLIPTLHEQGASIAAESYAQYTNKLGVALVTTGPGSTNALTGTASAWLDSIPMLLITGQVQNKDRVSDKKIRQMGFQEIDTVSLYKSITKYAVTVTDPKSIKYHIDKALHLATNGRPGPVVLDIPLDIQAADINIDELNSYEYFSDIKPIDSELIANIARSIQLAKRPIILVGNGVRLSNAIPELYEFINKTGIPVLTTWKALDIIEESHPQYVGRPGGVGQRGANFNQQNCDFILTIGARLDHGQLAYQPQYFAREAIKCIVDIDINEIKKLNTKIDFIVESDAKIFLTELNKAIGSQKLNVADWLIFCKNLHNKYPVITSNYLDTNIENINNYAFIEYLSELLPENSLIIPGSSGSCSEVTMQAFKCKKNTRIYNSEGLGSMGFGIPAAIGGCIASNQKETICIDGDGGFFMNIQELELVYRYNLPIKFFILNNNGYGSIRTTQNTHFKGNLVVSDPSSGLTLPSIRLNAQAYKIPYKIITNQEKLKNDIDAILNTDGPIICELIMDPNHKTIPKASVYKKEDGSFAASPMEDLAPFLDREEFMSNLLIKPLTNI
jgi:acetolactate synthase-1/2/3 large subunit